MEYLITFPTLGRETLRDIKKGVDTSFKEFSRSHGEGIENFFEPLLQFLVFFEKLLINSPCNHFCCNFIVSNIRSSNWNNDG